MERELNLQIPAGSQTAVAEAMARNQAETLDLQAIYFDTPTRELANARIALRLRLENSHWIQTLKAPGHDALSRIELNETRPEARLDLSLYHDTPFAKVFATLEGPLLPRYETRIKRQVFRVNRQGSVVELAYDQGAIVAGPLELPVHELEIELIQGDISAVFETGREWLSRYGLVIALRSKSERGDQLASAATKSPQLAQTPSVRLDQIFKARRARSLQLAPDMSSLAAYLACSNECLTQVIQNATVAAQIPAQAREPGSPPDDTHVPYVHQLRVGMRRLRSCWKLFKRLQVDRPSRIDEALVSAFTLLGNTRDNDVVQLAIKPQLLQAGMPDCVPETLATHAIERPSTVAAGSELQSALLDLLHHLVLLGDAQQKPLAADSTEAPSPSANTEALESYFRRRFIAWLKILATEGAKFADLPIDAQHDLRKKIKILRYSLEFSHGVLPPAQLEPLLATLEEAQHALGDLNDYYVAEAHYAAMIHQHSQAWFAIGWLRAMQRETQAQVTRLLASSMLKASGRDMKRQVPTTAFANSRATNG